MPYQPILATLVYVLSPDGQRVLMLHRDARKEDAHYGKYNGLGGKLQADENIVAGARREVQEESGLYCETLRLAGTISWPGFGMQGESWFGFIFRAEQYSGALLRHCAEGSLHWVERDKLLNLPLWAGDHHFLPLVFAEPLKMFHGIMPYDQGRPLHWQYSLLAQMQSDKR